MEDNGVYRSLIDETRPPQKKSSLPPPKLLLTAILVALGGPFNFGYQLLITNPAQEAFLQFLNESHFLNRDEYLEREQLEGRWSFIISIFFWGCTTGAFLIRGLSEKFGRKNALQISHALQIASCGLTIFSFFQTNAATYAIARFLLGFSITISLGTAPMFITECSPKECRGVTSLTNGVVLQVALVVGAVLAMPQLFGTVHDWWKLYAAELLLTIVVMIFVPFIHDSPGFLHSRGLGHASQRSLSFYHNIDGDALKLTIKQLEEENGNGQQFGLLSVWRDPSSRRGTLIGAVVMLSMAMSGIAAINAFAFEILLSTGLNVLQASVGNIVICLMSVLGILTSSFIIDRFGRRILLLSTYSLLGIINIVIASLMFGFEYAKVVALGYPLLGAICVFNFVFAAGPGPVSFFITGELVGQSGRGAACTWVNVLMCLLRSLLTASYLPLKNLIGQPASYFLLFFPPMVFTVFLLYFFLPETKGKTPSEVEEEWDNLPTLCKSRANQQQPSVDLKI
ncbi:transporter, major facilitator family protein [Ancylostoma caninum]|uniref:Transporter, major facilitator family protein n=1 Tax=Ancylostoma caninum TaxID=29170 RepID=A0A368H9V3_ANCCA|nr:transporter, major facilitator family protein [Ancylostoma caninum]